MGKSKHILVSKEADAKDVENLVKTLKTIMDSSDNLRKVVCDSHQALKAFEPGNEREKQLMIAF